MEQIRKRPTQEEKRIAKNSMQYISQGSFGKKTVIIEIEETGQTIPIPRSAFDLLVEILSNMADGKSITLIPSDSDISTQKAADMLNVSRPHIVKLLESGEIPFKKVGTHRRILLRDVVKYSHKVKAKRNESLDFLAEQAQNLNLGYE